MKKNEFKKKIVITFSMFILILSRGLYAYNDYDKNEYFRLNDKEIIELRRYHHNILIAKNRVRVKDSSYKVNVYNKNITKKIRRFKKDNSRWRIKRWLKRNAKPLTIRCALGVTLTTGLLFTAKGLLNNSPLA